jgi:hypothetical protein
MGILNSWRPAHRSFFSHRSFSEDASGGGRHPDARSLSHAIGAGLYTASPHCAQPNPWRAFRFYPLPMPVRRTAFMKKMVR